MAYQDFANSLLKVLLQGRQSSVPFMPRRQGRSTIADILRSSSVRSVPRRVSRVPRAAASGGNSDFEAFINAIAGQESGGKYNIRNKRSGAMGKYQIMPSNIRGSRRGWDYEALGRDVSEQEFMSNPQIQEAIARRKLQQYFQQYGAAGAATAWYGGPGALKRSAAAKAKKQAGGYPSINSYSAAILRRMARR